MGAKIPKAMKAAITQSLRIAPMSLPARAVAWDFSAMEDQTFSISGLPSRPWGRKISTMASIEKAATSLYSTEK